jgi:uncharacterized protein YndB with AHSA1/START domain
MTTSSLRFDCPIEQVFDALVDPVGYPSWLVGAQAIRSVDRAWPAPGSSFRHVIGVPPLLVPGSSTVRALTPPTELVLAAGMGFLGEATVRFRLREDAAGGTVVRVDERFVAGPAGWSWRFARPLLRPLVWGRNAVSLESLRDRLHADPDAAGGCGGSVRP